MRAVVDRVRSSGVVAALMTATVPVLFLWAHNARDQIRPRDVAIVLACAYAVTALCYLLLRAALRDPVRAGLATAVVVLLISVFGRLAAARSIYPGTAKAAMLLLGFGALAAALIVVIARTGSPPVGAVRGVIVIASILALLNLWTIVRADPVAEASADLTAGATVSVGPLAPGGPPRDVYYLVFDRYANGSILRDLYGFDNEPFLSALEERGMVVLDDAVANYPGTTHSLASSLNMTYLDDLASKVGEGSDDWEPIQRSLRGSAVMEAFDRLGYRTVHIGSWWEGTFADPAADTNFVFGGLREFPEAYLYTTAVPWLAEGFGLVDIRDPARTQYERVAYQLDAIRETTRDPGPTFTFAHLTLPHTPYVFDADGGFRAAPFGAPVEPAYLDQLRATNTMILALVDDLLAGSDEEDPIVVLQSDEGPHPPPLDGAPELRVEWPHEPVPELERKLRILDALYLPGLPPERVDPEMTPVNTFRMVFDEYFGGTLPILEDRVWVYESYDRPFAFVEVTDRLRP